MEFERDCEGVAAANSDDEHRLLAGFLQSDVQEDTVTGEALIQHAQQCLKDSAYRYEFIGNAHQLVMTAEGVTITRLSDSESRAFELAIFQEQLAAWLKFVAQAPSA